MTTAVSRGSYYKQKTVRWFRAQAYWAAFLERVLYIQGRHGLIPCKRDQLGSDVLAINAERAVFVQVKGGASWRSGLAAARAEFAKYPLPRGCEQWILGWTPHARAPEIEIVAIGPQPADHPVTTPPRRKAKALPLFQRPA